MSDKNKDVLITSYGDYINLRTPFDSLKIKCPRCHELLEFDDNSIKLWDITEGKKQDNTGFCCRSCDIEYTIPIKVTTAITLEFFIDDIKGSSKL